MPPAALPLILTAFGASGGRRAGPLRTKAQRHVYPGNAAKHIYEGPSCLHEVELAVSDATTSSVPPTPMQVSPTGFPLLSGFDKSYFIRRPAIIERPMALTLVHSATSLYDSVGFRYDIWTTEVRDVFKALCVW